MPRGKAYNIVALGSQSQGEFQVDSETERFRLLKEMRDLDEPVTVHLGDMPHSKKATYVTQIVAVDPDKNLLLIEPAQKQEINDKIAELAQLPCATQLKNVPIEFIIESPRLAKYQDKQVFASAIPGTLLRLQRREFYRMNVPTHSLTTCSFPTEMGPLKVEISDISLGGIGIQFNQEAPVDFPIGGIFEECTLHLPGASPFTVDLQVQNILNLELDNGRQLQQIGLEFLDLPEHLMSLIQRFIFSSERSRLKSR